ncbi:MAG: tripartite tricarboxylate transporter substrate binding protein [Sphingomonadaceae bacterium]
MNRTLRLGLLAMAASVLTVACSTAAPGGGSAAPTKAPASTASPAGAAPTSVPAGGANPASVDYPTKPVTLQIPFAAGGTTDIGARILASAAEKELGQSLVVVNKEGAGSQVGLTELASQKPDGYYIGFVNLPAVNTILLSPERKATFSLDSFDFIVNHVYDPIILAVKHESPYKTFNDLVEDAKKRPGEIRVGTSGALTPEHLAALQFEEAVGTKFRIAHFDGSAGTMTQFRGGHTDIAFTSMALGKDLKVLAVLSPERVKQLPDVPTTVELGYPSIVMASSRGVAAPKGTPAPVLKKLEDVFAKVIESPDHVEKMQTAGFPVKLIRGEEYRKYVQEVHSTAGKLVELAKNRK